ncbi:MAG: poly-gamma-glutamate system protein [bacterium]|nr:poly-gamma-glutamate system protein [bacterium]
MSSLSDRRRKLVLFSLALLALGMQIVLETTRTQIKQHNYELKLEAATMASEAFDAVRRHRLMEGAVLDLINDPAGTGLIGPEFSPITNAQGVLESKLTTLNPNWAAVLIDYFKNIGLKPGDPVALAVSGSFPGMNICLYAAIEAMELHPEVITSIGASMWGANDPAFTWLDMESLFLEEKIFHIKSAGATYGGGNDMGRGLNPEGRRLISECFERNEVELIASNNIEDAITKRMTFYEERVRGRRYYAYINVGGGVASLGSSQNKIVIPQGVFTDLGVKNFPRKGTMILMSEKGVPVVHLLNMRALATAEGLPIAPDYLPEPGEGEIFVKHSYRLMLVVAFLVLYCLTCVLVLAPELRRGLFDKWSGKVDGDTV